MVSERGRFRPSAALADAAFVVAEDDEPCVGERAGQLAENRDAEREAVAIAWPEPPVSTTAGSGVWQAAAGFDSVPASEKPFAGIRTRSSFGREMTTCLEATDAMSSRATSRLCAGTVSRSSRPFSSPQILMSSGRFGVLIVTCVRFAAISRADV